MKTTYFYDERQDRIVLVSQNVCNCHPFDLLVEYGKKYGEAYTLSFSNQDEVNKYLKQRVTQYKEIRLK